MKTLKNIHNIIENNDVETVAYIRNEALEELSRFEVIQASGEITARERVDMAINTEIIRLAEDKLNAVAVF